jgi:hypothetical protein
VEEQLLQGVNEVQDVISLGVHSGSDLVLASLLYGTLLILHLVAPLKPQSEQPETAGDDHAGQAGRGSEQGD